MRRLLLLLLPLFFLCKPSIAFAGDVVINEFLVEPEAEQWVELYNKGATSFDISGWVIDDNGGIQAYDIPPGTTISSGEFRVFSSSYFNLNRASADRIRLLNGTNEEDSYSYPTGPGIQYTYGRIIDGTGSWGIFSSPTKGSSNNVSTPQSTPTTQPTATPTPSKTPTPTHTPTSTKSPTPTKAHPPTSTKKSEGLSLAKKDIPSVAPTSTLRPTEEDRDVPTAVLGEQTNALETPTITPTPTGEQETKILGISKNTISMIFVTLGSLFLLACAILVFFKVERNKNG